MKILIKQFLLRNHSWSHCGRGIATGLKQLGHDVHLFGTDGTDNGFNDIPNDLRSNLIGYTKLNEHKVFGKEPDKDYDCQISYTAMKNFKSYLSYGNKNRFGIWNFETTILPQGFAKHYKDCDIMLPSSNFSKEIFAKNKIPNEHMIVIPHGVDIDRYQNAKTYELKTKKNYRILANIAQPHIRKNIPGLLQAYGKAFTNKDDVCLVLKISNTTDVKGNEISFDHELKVFRNQFKNAAEIEIISGYVENIEEIYKACNIGWTMSHSECFWMPGLEGLCANQLILAPRHGGQLDFLNNDNSLLIDGKEIKSDLRMQYWTQSPYAAVFDPNIDSAVEVLRNAVNNYDSLMTKFKPNIEKELLEYSWENVAKKIVNLCKE